MDPLVDLKAKICEEMLSCQICFEAYKEPKSLPCLHSFCKNCLAAYIRKSVKQRADVSSDIPCPMCRELFDLPDGGVNALKTNFVFNNLADLMGENSEKVDKDQKTCDSCEDDTKVAVMYCAECDDNLCQECVEAHSKVKLTRTHELSSLAMSKEVESDNDDYLYAIDGKGAAGGVSYDTEKPGTGWLCDKHVNQHITCICKQCVLPLCPFCISDILSGKNPSHKKHDIVGIEDAMSQFSKSMENQLESLRDNISAVEEKISSIEDNEVCLEETYNSTKNDVASKCKDVQSALAKWNTNVMKTLETDYKKNKEEMESYKGLLASNLETLNRDTSEISKLITSNDATVLMRQEELTKKIKLLQQFITNNQSSSPKSLTFSLQVTEEGVDVKAQLLKLLGELNVKKIESSTTEEETSLQSVAEKPTRQRSSVKAFIKASFQIPDICMVGITVGRWTGDFFAVDSKSRNLLQYSLDDSYRFTFIKKRGGGKTLRDPLDVDQLPDGRVVVSDGKEGHCVKVFDPELDKYEVVAHMHLKKACGVTCTKDGAIVVTDVDEQAILILQEESKEGKTAFKLKHKIDTFKENKQFDNPQYLACSDSGKIVVSDRMKHIAKSFDAATAKHHFTYGQFGKLRNFHLDKPEGVCVDSEDHYYVMDVGNERIHVLSSNGTFIGHIKINQLRAKFEPPPSMLAMTRQGDLVLANMAGMIKILQVTITEVANPTTSTRNKNRPRPKSKPRPIPSAAAGLSIPPLMMMNPDIPSNPSSLQDLGSPDEKGAKKKQKKKKN